MRIRRRYLFVVVSIGSMFATIGSQGAFTETFSAPSDIVSLESMGWHAHVGNTAAALDSEDLRSGKAPFVSNNKFLYYLLPSLKDQSILVWTDKVPSFGEIDKVGSVAFTLMNADAEEKLKLAVRIADQWYISDEGFAAVGAKKEFQVNPSTMRWHALDFVPGEKLMEKDAVELPKAGAITAVGFFNPAYGSSALGPQKVRIVNLSVGDGALPKPSAAPAASGGGAASSPPSKTNPYGITTLTPPVIKMNPSPKYWPRVRMWQGIPSVAVTPGGRLWATWYAGPVGEGEEGNYALLVTSGDGGKTWSRPVAVFDASLFFDGNTGDPHLYVDPDGRLWWFVNRSLQISDPKGNRSTWGIRAENGDDAATKWATPVFAGYGIALNKLTALSTGEWIRPVDTFNSKQPDTRTLFYRSVDKGQSYEYLSAAVIKDVSFPEHMVVERKDGSLLMMARTTYGIAQAESLDKGKTWINEKPFSTTMNVNTRFYLGKLKSGNWLLVVNDVPKGRKNMTAMLSEDEGKTWPYKLVLDERDAVSYPDASEDSKGNIYITYDRGRYLKDQQEILLARVTEADIKAGKLLGPESYLKQMINKLADFGGGVHEDREPQGLTKIYEGATESLKELEEKKQKSP